MELLEDFVKTAQAVREEDQQRTAIITSLEFISLEEAKKEIELVQEALLADVPDSKEEHELDKKALIAVSRWSLSTASIQRQKMHKRRLGTNALAVFPQKRMKRHQFMNAYGNIDHVVVSPSGLFAVETEMVSKPKMGEDRAKR